MFDISHPMAFFMYITFVIILPILYGYYLFTSNDSKIFTSQTIDKYENYKKYYEGLHVESYETMTDSLMKIFEDESENIRTICNDQSFVIRLNYNNKSIKSYSHYFEDSMIQIMTHIVVKFIPEYACVSLYEILLVFNVNNMKNDFDMNIDDFKNNILLYANKCANENKNFFQYKQFENFTAKVIIFPNLYEQILTEYVVWRNLLQTKLFIKYYNYSIKNHNTPFIELTMVENNDETIIEQINELKTIFGIDNKLTTNSTHMLYFSEKSYYIFCKYPDHNIIDKLIFDPSLYITNFGNDATKFIPIDMQPIHSI